MTEWSSLSTDGSFSYGISKLSKDVENRSESRGLGSDIESRLVGTRTVGLEKIPEGVRVDDLLRRETDPMLETKVGGGKTEGGGGEPGSTL